MNQQQFLANFTGNIEGIDAASVGLQTRLRDIPQWDSMAILTTLAMIDTEYGVQISGNEIQKCVLVMDLFSAVEKKVAK